MLDALYGARIEATRRLLPRRAITAAIRALRDERHAAVRALVERREWAVAAERREAKRLRRPVAPAQKLASKSGDHSIKK